MDGFLHMNYVSSHFSHGETRLILITYMLLFTLWFKNSKSQTHITSQTSLDSFLL